MQSGYLTRDEYAASVQDERLQAIREELLEIDKEIMAAVDLKTLQPSQAPPAGFYASQHWSRAWEYPWCIERLCGASQSIEGMRILDVGPGLSPLPVYLARHGARVTCIDTHPVGLLDVKTIKMDIRNWNSDENFDAITCISVLEHIPNVDIVGLLSRWMYGPPPGRAMPKVGRVLLTLDIPLTRECRYGVAFPPFADLLAWLCEWYGSCPCYPSYDKTMNSSDFGRQGEIVGKEIGVFYLELGD